ncbi:PucR family transcriptional regulator [Microbacterium sp. SORGH_AS_0888]|uniref:PucR family transcriptional regulator n=1 Tax=Microbacterium sp. SORGH_AS_0888 TaxID=3041791 RepID=UPI00277FB93F|nr:PucR family transcriptional regulator [Microbacterium sp. SORGH_AS_0888]MDQ1130490.1 purine catabolism regulator [Microbacterium sp. SORGH_AS_0888]
MIRLPLYGRARSELPSVADVLESASLRRGDPVVVGGVSGLDRTVRWVHVSEVPGIADLLRGGEMLLTTGMVLPAAEADLADYIERLADAGVAALTIGLGPRFSEPLPAAMIAAADRRGFPLIALRRTIAFIDVTEEVHAALVDVQVRELQASENIHVIFSSLAVRGSRPDEVLLHVAKLSGFAVVLENNAHQVLAFDPAERSRGDVLAEWAEHNQRAPRRGRTFYDPQTGWLQTIVGARGNDWGRLILMAGDAGVRDVTGKTDPTLSIPRSLIMLVEQAASTLAIGRLVERESELLDLSTHQSVLANLLAGAADERELDQQGSALGVSIRRMSLTALAARARTASAATTDVRVLATIVADAARRAAAPSLAAPIDDAVVGALLRLPAGDERAFAERLTATAAEHGMDIVVGIAGPDTGVEQARAGLAESIETVNAAVGIGHAAGAVRWDELGVRGLLYALRDDPRLHRFAERSLGELRRYDEEKGTTLVALLRHYLDAGRNKTTAAARAYVSRPWMHERLRRIEAVLGVDLENEEDCMTLQVALAISEQNPADAATLPVRSAR